MVILTVEQIKNECETITFKLSSYDQLLHALFQLMLNTGVRTVEAVNSGLWQLIDPTTVKLTTAKFGDTRLIQTSDIPPLYLSYITASQPVNRIYSTDNLRKHFNQFTSFPTLMCEHKQISCHLYRHNFIKQLYAQGYSIEEIAIILGHVNPTSTAGYVNSVIYYE